MTARWHQVGDWLEASDTLREQAETRPLPYLEAHFELFDCPITTCERQFETQARRDAHLASAHDCILKRDVERLNSREATKRRIRERLIRAGLYVDEGESA